MCQNDKINLQIKHDFLSELLKLPSPKVAVPGQAPTPQPALTPVPRIISGEECPVARRGQLIFQRTAGGVGCASCHGNDSKGTQGPGSYIRGRSAEGITFALNNVRLMSSIKLTLEEIADVADYLKYLEMQP